MENPNNLFRYKLLRIARRFLLLLIRILRAIESKMWKVEVRTFKDIPLLQEDKVVASTVYDMASEPGENYYAAQYLRSLERFINDETGFGRIVDFGCGQGRLTMPIAQKFPSAEVIGVDISKDAVDDAVINSLKAGITNVSYENSTIDDYLNHQLEFPIDLAFFTEVGFYHPNWKEDLSKIFTILAPGGLLLASFRSTYFTMMLQLRQRNFQSALQILSSEDGQGRVTPDDDLIFTWINSVDLKEFCISHGMLVLDLFGIGTASGIQGDIFDDFAQPGLLQNEELQILEAIENRYSHLIPDVGRYITVVLQKPLN